MTWVIVGCPAVPLHEDMLDTAVHDALRQAALAPSGHNAQPWLFGLGDGTIELWADRTRRIPVIDREDRELTISCGAALLNLRVALEQMGRCPLVGLLPDPGAPDLLARVRLAQGDSTPDQQSSELAQAIPLRRTHRPPFQDLPVAAREVERLLQAAVLEGGRLICLEGTAREQVADLIAESNLRMAREARYRHEMERWLADRGSPQAEELPTDPGDITLLDPDFASGLAGLVMRFSDGFAAAVSGKDHSQALKAPLLVVVATASDEVADWIKAGMALERVLLCAAGQGIQASYLNGPLEFPDSRAVVAEMIGAVPQLILRMGYAARELRAAPRRPLESLLRKEPA